jgi:type IV secretory pathway VirB4 component
VRALCSSLLLDTQPATWRSLQGWATTLPLGVDALSVRRSFDTAALSAAYPFASGELSSTTGVLYGTAAKGAGLVCWDRFAQDNYNSVILARSGAGKSYLAKLEALRSLYRGIEVAVVDPEDEYARLSKEVGGAYVHLGAPGVRVNPFDLTPGPEPLVRQALFVHTLVAVLLGEPVGPAAKPALDRAILAAYEQVGITNDPRTHARPAPLLANLTAALDAAPDDEAQMLAARLAPFVTGTHRGLFDGPTTQRPDGHLVVFSLRDLPDELKAAGTLLTLNNIWRRVANPAARRRRLVIVDEAWLLMRDPEGARFLFRMAKSARKHWCGLTVVTQDAADLLGSPLGQAVVANAATQILLRQAPQAIDALAEAFRLSEGERAYLLGAQRGEGLLACGSDRVAFAALSSSSEHDWCTSDPAELAGSEPDL